MYPFTSHLSYFNNDIYEIDKTSLSSQNFNKNFDKIMELDYRQEKRPQY